MSNIVNRAEVLQLLSELERHQNKLTLNELEMYRSIKSRYKAFDDESFDDKVCLEVMLRNIGIRDGYGMDKNEATRVIDLDVDSSNSNS